MPGLRQLCVTADLPLRCIAPDTFTTLVARPLRAPCRPVLRSPPVGSHYSDPLSRLESRIEPPGIVRGSAQRVLSALLILLRIAISSTHSDIYSDHGSRPGVRKEPYALCRSTVSTARVLPLPVR